jgi:hypothetical protein
MRRHSGSIAKWLLIAIGICGYCPSVTALADDKPAEATAANPLQSIGWMTGGTWKAEAKTPDGKVTLVESQLRWAENGQAIEFVSRFNGSPHYSGLYCWDPSRKTIAFWYTSADGEFTQGTAKMDANVLTQEFDLYHKDGTGHHLKSRIQRTGENSYHWNVMAEKNGTWTELIALDYAR